MEGIDENKCVYIPQKQLEKYTLSCINNIEISSLVSCPIKITIPLDSSKESIMLGGVRWKDILVDEQNYYSTDDIDFKQILLSFDYDSMNNMFVIGEDMYNHRKVQKIN